MFIMFILFIFSLSNLVSSHIHAYILSIGSKSTLPFIERSSFAICMYHTHTSFVNFYASCFFVCRSLPSVSRTYLQFSHRRLSTWTPNKLPSANYQFTKVFIAYFQFHIVYVCACVLLVYKQRR